MNITNDAGKTPVPPEKQAPDKVSDTNLWAENKRLLTEVNKLRQEALVLQKMLTEKKAKLLEYEALFEPVSPHKLILDCDERLAARMSLAGWEPVQMSSATRPGVEKDVFGQFKTSPVVVSIVWKRDDAPCPSENEGKEPVKVDQPSKSGQHTPPPAPIPESGEGEQVPDQTEDIPVPAAEKMVVDVLPLNYRVLGIDGEQGLSEETRNIIRESQGWVNERWSDPAFREKAFDTFGRVF